MSPSLQERFAISKFGLVPIKELHFPIVPWSRVNSAVLAPTRQGRLSPAVLTVSLAREPKCMEMGTQSPTKGLETSKRS